jgi:sec-independent protein translocase protein TatA
MNVFGIGLPEMAVIAAIALLVFGPKRLPELGKTLGRTLKGFQSASQGFEEQFRTALEPGPEPSQSAPTGPTTEPAGVTQQPIAAEASANDAAPSSGSSAS